MDPITVGADMTIHTIGKEVDELERLERHPRGAAHLCQDRELSALMAAHRALGKVIERLEARQPTDEINAVLARIDAERQEVAA